MIDTFIKSYYELIEIIKKRRKYIRSKKIKQLIINYYEEKWLPYSKDFKKQYGAEYHDKIENTLYAAYSMCRKEVVAKKKLKETMIEIENIIETLKLNLIRDYGFIIEKSRKEKVVDNLKNLNFKGTIKYIKSAEKEFEKGEMKTSCDKSRLSVDEFFREFREKVFNTEIYGVSATEHIAALNNKLNITKAEQALIKNGIYVFLSHKGGHATTDNPTPEDAKLSLDITYALFNYFIEKFSKYFS